MTSSTLTIARDGIKGHAAFHVQVDGAVVGKVRRKETVRFPVSEGEHEIRVLAKIPVGVAVSPTIRVHVRSTGGIQLTCGSRPAGLVYLIFGLFGWDPLNDGWSDRKLRLEREPEEVPPA